ncbi:subtilisin-like protein [Fistulina hepatica ATCC 64428]|uniref:tripeptidyl-peptidase II n=1 Tax=Fistulina hepatica ATCC 64428 TaxID=1128425 RepID=A0A0D7A4T0_9AGAR|nr:subtilisin-like protein [Fistulina hepatica ATCC 64428]
MLSWLLVVSLTAVLQTVRASPVDASWSDFVEKHSWSSVPKGYEYYGPASPDYQFTLRVGLKKPDRDQLISNLYEVSDPRHHRYGMHLSKAEVDSLTAPHPSSVEAVESWLEYHGIDQSDVLWRSGSGAWVNVRVSVAQAEAMLGPDTKYNIYYHPKSSSFVVRTLGYSVPAALHDHIDVVAPTTYFGTIKSMRTTSFLDPQAVTEGVGAMADTDEISMNGSVSATCAVTITPDCLIALYNTTDYTPSATSSNSLGVCGYLDEYASDADLQARCFINLVTFLESFVPDAVGTTFTYVEVNDGGNDQSDPGTEANLDIQYTEALSHPTPNIYYSTGGSPPYIADDATPTDTNEPYLDWLQYILDQDSIPQTFSTSYGDDEQSVPLDYAESVCALFAELGARGSSVLFSSGDDGVGAGDCKTNNGSDVVAFQPAFPASCPYVTAVGGVTGIDPEESVSFSGGGFSNYFDMPSYQTDVVTSYLSDNVGTEYAGLYNASGRAYPDVAAQAEDFLIVISGQTYGVSGTSCSSPTVAGIISLLNDYLISNNQSALGFLNPLIYSTASGGFNDITSGPSNSGCDTNGFSVAEGWDPVTGWGTPDFVALQKLVYSA